MKNTRSLLLFVTLLLAGPIHAINPENVASFDRLVIEPSELFFEEDSRIIPDRTYVNMRNFRAMSTPAGERSGMVTLENQLNSRQILDREEFVGIFADGSRSYPDEFEITLDPGRTRTVVFIFGQNTYPLVKIVIDNGA